MSQYPLSNCEKVGVACHMTYHTYEIGSVLFIMATHRSLMTTTDQSDHKEKEKDDEMLVEDKKKLLAKDRWSIFLLLILYTLQGIPIGLAGSIPMVLQAKKVGYRQQAVFSFVSWPFSVKLLWAPVVDAIYSRSFGRRKSWLIPVQYLIGGIMIVMSYYINSIIGEEGDAPNIFVLTSLFFLLFVCAATQDIAVDGWAITMLSRESVGHLSTCNSIGQTVGYFMGYTVFLAFESKEFCNTYLRSEPQDYGIVDLPTFLFFWGVVFITVTTLVMIFKREKREVYSEVKQTISSAYMQLWSILKLRPVQSYAIFLLTAKVGLAAAENVTGLKLVEAGLPREKIGLIALPMVPVQILLPLFIRLVYKYKTTFQLDSQQISFLL